MTDAAGSPASIEAVVFDIGGVLLDWDPRNLYRKLITDEAAREAFLRDVCTLEWHSSHDLGTPFTRSCAALARDHPEHADLIWAWGARSEEMVAGPIAGTVELLRELRATGTSCYALTNMERETYAKRFRRYAFMRWFDGVVVSSDEGLIKPDPEIFHVLLSRFALDPARTLMVDDALPNIQAAAGVGMPAVRFTTAEALRKTFVRCGLLGQ